MEFEQLSAKLSSIADNLELTEEQIFRIYAKYQGKAWDGSIEYPDSFNIRDVNADLEFYITALNTPVNSETYRRGVQMEIVKTVLGADSEQYADIEAEILREFEPHLMISPSGETLMATTEAMHLALSRQGWTHQA